MAGDIRSQTPSILESTKQQWVTLQYKDGYDMLNFTYLNGWRCGIDSIEFIINETDVYSGVIFPPCDNPNQLSLDSNDGPTTLLFDGFSVQSVTIRIFFTDGTVSVDRRLRREIFVP